MIITPGVYKWSESIVSRIMISRLPSRIRTWFLSGNNKVSKSSVSEYRKFRNNKDMRREFRNEPSDLDLDDDYNLFHTYFDSIGDR